MTHDPERPGIAMANQADPFCERGQPDHRMDAHGAGDARAGMAKAEMLAGEIQTLPLYEHVTQIMPAPDVVFGGGMLLLVVMAHAAGLRLASNRFERRRLCAATWMAHAGAPLIAISGLFTFGWTGSVLVEIVRRCQEVKTAAAKVKARQHRHPADTKT